MSLNSFKYLKFNGLVPCRPIKLLSCNTLRSCAIRFGSSGSKFNCISLFYFKRNCFYQQGTYLHQSSSMRRQKSIGQDVESKVRNIGIMAHIDAGKTTTTERMLFYSGFSKRLGDVDHGDTIMDYMEQERDRGITITSAAITFHWGGHKINLIDTPGHVDFTVEVERALRVLDGAVAILDASAGVEAQTMTVWRQADHYKIPRIVYLNKMDKPGASLELCLNSLRSELHVNPLILNIPLGSGKTFSGVCDLIHGELFTWDSKHCPEGRLFKRKPLTRDVENYDLYIKARGDLVEQLADYDDDLADLVLSDTKLENIDPKTLIKAARKATISNKLVPILCGSSLKNKGVQPVMDAINLYLPSPNDINHGFVEHYSQNLCALSFKVIHDSQRGPLVFSRIYSGVLKPGEFVYNINQTKSEKAVKLYQVYADEYTNISSASAGNIVAISGLSQTMTGDTLTHSVNTAREAAKAYLNRHNSDDEKNNERPNELETDELLDVEEVKDSLTSDMIPILAGVPVPHPVFFCSIEALSATQQESLEIALERLQREDPSLKVRVDSETGQTILSGMGELHLDIIKSRLHKEYKLDVDLGPLMIAYRETIEEPTEYTMDLDKELSGKKQFVHLKISLSPDEDEREFSRVNLVRDNPDDLPHEIKHKHLKAINLGVKSGLACGILLRYPVIHTKVNLHEFSTTYSTTLPMITSCVAAAVQEALKLADCSLLEPMMKMEITTEEKKVNTVMADLAKRRSHILDSTCRQNTRIINALTPLKELFGYSTKLRTLTSGTATCSMEISHYEKMSKEEEKRVFDTLAGFKSPT